MPVEFLNPAALEQSPYYAEVDPNTTYPAVIEVWGRHMTPVTVISVVRLGRPGALVEVSAVAAI